MGSQMFVKNQYGIETVKGTAVPATKRFLGTANVPKDREPVHPPYTLAQRVMSHSTEIYQLLADPVTLEMADGYYQALPMFFDITLKGAVTPTEVTTAGAGAGDWLWDFTPVLTAAAVPDTITLEVGDNDQNYEIEYLMGKKITFDFALGDASAVKVSMEAFGRQVTKSTVTAGIAAPAVTSIIADTAKFYVDSTWATLGNTQKTGLLRSGSIEIATGNHPKFLGSGNKYFDTFGEGYLEVTGSFVLEGGAEAVTKWDDFAAGTARAIKLSFTGPAIGVGTNHSLILNMYVAFDEVIPLSGFADGNTLYAVTFSGISDNQATPHMVGATVTTNMAAI